ncbi:uncharacterized protein LOC34620139 [Cyclospora cayetanensis]|uniref:Uncharacterized protein LOC34620139 n=1 Tax=Cyclospora cayetanensis TaxID=88456 RepID=A0A6P6RYW4_9EIME|nr:uncharacterized protein LOC34620139 [Cyclospora cayetanensis]
MADFTPQEQFSIISQQLLLLDQLCAQDKATKLLEAVSPQFQPSHETQQVPMPVVTLRDADTAAGAHLALRGEREVRETVPMGSEAPAVSETDLLDVRSPKELRFQLMQRASMEHQQQLLRQRALSQQQQRLVFQRSQERNAAPHDLAQLFSDIHEARKQQCQHRVPQTGPAAHEQKLEGWLTATSWRHHSSKVFSEDDGISLSRHHRTHEASGAATSSKRDKKLSGQSRDADRQLEPHQREDPRHLVCEDPQNLGENFSEKRRQMLRAAALLDTSALLTSTLHAFRSSNTEIRETEGPKMDIYPGWSYSDKNSGDSRCDGDDLTCNLSRSQISASPPALDAPRSPASGKVIQVHGEPLSPAFLCASLPSRCLSHHCLRVTLHARRCSIRTRRYWRALVPLFPRRSTYTPAAVLSDEDMGRYVNIRPRITDSQDPVASLESWAPPKEPFTAPGLYRLEEGTRILGAWGIAVDDVGCLRRCTAAVGDAEGGTTERIALTRRKRPKVFQNLSQHQPSETPWSRVLKEAGTTEAEGLQTLERWYTRTAREPPTEQQIWAVTPEEYAAAFGDYAEGLVASLERLIQMRQPPTQGGGTARSCGCPCSVCSGQLCRVRLAWRRTLMAFEVAVDKAAAERLPTDSSGEESGEGTVDLATCRRPVSTTRSNKGGWEWCRICPLGCRMQFRLILHELYQPLSLTRSGFRSAVGQMLLRLRQYVILSPLAAVFLMQRVRQIRHPHSLRAGVPEARKEADDVEGCKGARSSHVHSWATRDWAEACLQRRRQSLTSNESDIVVTSGDLDKSVTRLSMLSTNLYRPPATRASEEKICPMSAVDGGHCEAIPWLPEAVDNTEVAKYAPEQLRLLLGAIPLHKGLVSPRGAERNVIRAAAASGVVGDHEYEEEDTHSPRYSYPVSLASSQVPSTCSTPPAQSRRPRIGRCFAVPRNAGSQGSDGASGNSSSATSQECELHNHCDGNGRARRGRTFDRDDCGRFGNGGDGYGGDGVDVSPRRLRRMPRARLTSDELHATPARLAEISRRVMPLVPWWWGDYIKTGAAQESARPDSRTLDSNECDSDSSSSVSSTISLAAAPHLFRIPYEPMLEASQSSAGVSAGQVQNAGTGTTVAQTNDALTSQNRIGISMAFHEGADAVGIHSGDLPIELIHAAAELVDSLDNWPFELGERQTTHSIGLPRGHGLLTTEQILGLHIDTTAPASNAAGVPGSGQQGRKAKQQKGPVDSSLVGLQPGSSQGILTFVSSILCTPSDGEVECVKGFELLEGVLNTLFDSTNGPIDQSLEAYAVVSLVCGRFGVPTGATDTRNGTPHISDPLDFNSRMQVSATNVFKTKTEHEDASKVLSEAARRTDNATPVYLDVTTPLLRSLAASATPAAEPTQDRLAVDDFYALPLLKRAVSYRDTYEPFDKDYTDVQIRLKPLRAFGVKQQRYSRFRRRSWRQSPQSSGSSPRGSSHASSRSQGSAALDHTKGVRGGTGTRLGTVASLGERSGTVRIGGRRVVVRNVEGVPVWASQEPGTGGLSDFSISRCSMSVDSNLSSRGVSVCSRATSNAGSTSDTSLQGGAGPQSSSAHERGAARQRRGRSRPAPGGRGQGGGGNSSTPTGVYLDVARKLWRCQWRENGRFKTKSFPLNQYKTLKEARRACVVFRCLMGGWEVQPAWLGDDEGGDIDASDNPESLPASSGGDAGVETIPPEATT